MIELRKIDHDNFNAILKLELDPAQKDWVAQNIYSLAEAYVDHMNNDTPPMPFAIYNSDEIIGFAMMEYCDIEDDDDEPLWVRFKDRAIYNFFRFMIDVKHQGKGYGKLAFAKVLEYLKTQPQGRADAISISYMPENNVARKIYASFGFVETGDIEDSEIVARLAL
ncbi:MAG: GNAT family N-acetyltransferase [Defluviitaleaceae bacterium]|nr:GNAT family N-acetyltransferase [Defluviitaleaceae bacterium]